MLQETSVVIPNFTQLNDNLQIDIYLNGNHIDINAQRHIAFIFQKFILSTKPFSSKNLSGHRLVVGGGFWAGRAPLRRMVALPRGARLTDVAVAAWVRPGGAAACARLA